MLRPVHEYSVAITLERDHFKRDEMWLLKRFVAHESSI